MADGRHRHDFTSHTLHLQQQLAGDRIEQAQLQGAVPDEARLMLNGGRVQVEILRRHRLQQPARALALTYASNALDSQETALRVRTRGRLAGQTAAACAGAIEACLCSHAASVLPCVYAAMCSHSGSACVHTDALCRPIRGHIGGHEGPQTR